MDACKLFTNALSLGLVAGAKHDKFRHLRVGYVIGIASNFT